MRHFEFTDVDHLGRGVRHGFIIAVSNGKGGKKAWGDEIFETWDAARSTALQCVPGLFDIAPAREVIHFGKNPVSHSYHRSILIGDKDDASHRWYAVRVAPGFQRMARAIEGLAEHRRGESIVERNLREENIDVFMPAFWKELRKHRSRKLVERRLPLLVGYAFIRHDPGTGFDPVRDVDGVSSIVSRGRDGGPIEFLEKDIQTLMIWGFDQHQAYKFKRATALETARHSRRMKLNTELGRILPRGRSRTVSLRYHADACIGSLDNKLKERVLGIIQLLDGLETDEHLDAYREAV
ncbi:transcription termination/antitermination NusG family protein [Ensifer sp. ENS07]|uniref:transcription termination/antitermination NusG family protein n=1 Tax=Ensifer sp. ENS07 TaxID=2769274 RepID=UPI00177EAA2B|nr:transcription termination/antitermination NusG family protein [Ensifer sp. ENS07]MBD9640754.1 transcription termination/antitermination NusG family protein [Ensifer sp. ENS07]